MKNILSCFDPFHETKQTFMKGTQKEKEEDDISIGASILVSVSVLKLAEEPTANIEGKVQHPSHHKKENNDDELVRTHVLGFEKSARLLQAERGDSLRP